MKAPFHSIFLCCVDYIQNTNIKDIFPVTKRNKHFCSCIVGVYEGYMAMYKTLIKIKIGYKELNSCCRDCTENLLFFIIKV